MTNTNIDLLLYKNTKMSEDQVRSLLDSPVIGTTDSIGQKLSQKKYGTVDEIIIDLCKELGVDFIKDIPVNDIPVDLIRHIPINYAKTHEIMPIREESNQLLVLTSNPINTRSMDDLRVIFGKKVVPVISTSERVQDAINRVYEKSTAALEGLDTIEGEDYDLDDPIVDLLDAADDDAPVIKLVNTLLFRGVKEKCSDIHIEPYEKDISVRFRIDGLLYEIFKPPKRLQNAITSRIKVMGNLNIAEKRLPQDGRIPLKVGGKDIDIRLNTIPTSHGERIVMRLQDRSNVILELDQLGFSKRSLTILEDNLLTKTYGIILVTGPTGSGKSTTLYACLQKINAPNRNIITIENPVEQNIHGIGQIQTNSKIGLTFASGLRAILRQDPDIVMIGEIRDLETAEISINASLTGHLVLSTIHTNDASGVFPRLIDMGCEPFLIATSIMGVLAQRLIRVLCPHCKVPYEPTDIELASIDMTRQQAKKGNPCKPMGCHECNQKGYIGRTNVQELLVVTDEVRSMIMQRVDSGQIKAKAIEQGMLTVRDHGVEKVLNGVTSIEEILSSTQVDN